MDTSERTLKRFWAKVEVNEETGCWEWTGAKVHDGYGKFWDGGKDVYAHRFAWETERCPIPEGLELDHLCRTRSCVRPDHLEPVDHRTNVLRGVNANTAKTECPQGHPYNEANTYVWPNGWRYCRECKRLRNREYRRRALQVAR